MTNYNAIAKPYPDKAVEDNEIMINETDKSITNRNAIENKPRISGSLKGQIWISDTFDEPMSEDALASWYDAPIFPDDK